MRIVKEHDERRNEILDCAERLFHSKGFERCTVNDILKEVNIAKGTFYYYFKSKEEVLDAIVCRYNDFIETRVIQIVNNMDLSPEEKLIQTFRSMNISNEVGTEMLDEVHKQENALLHQKILKNIVELLAPLLAQVIQEGNEKKKWNCKYPMEDMQIFLAASLTLMDDGIFELTPQEQEKVMIALIAMIAEMLQLPEELCLNMFMKYCGQQQDGGIKE